MSELKVVVDGKEREIRGVNEETTCENIILVLAKAAGKTGKAALLERWRGYERILPPEECPLKCMQSWGSYKDEVTLVLQDESLSTYNHLNKTSINLRADDKSDLIKRSLDCESLEDLVTIQRRKIESLARATEIIKLHFSCWDSNEEAFLYSTEEEIAEDLAVELEKVLKLQANELVELKTCENELTNLEQTFTNLSKQRDSFGDKISKIEERIAEAYDAVDMLLEDLEKEENSCKEMRTSETDSARMREELEVISRKLSQQNALFSKQDLEMNSISSSMSDLNDSVQIKNDIICRLKEEIESCIDDFSMTENFLPKVPEVESTKRRENGNVGLYQKDIETAEILESLKMNHEDHEIQYSTEKMEKLKKRKESKNEIIRDSSNLKAFFESESHQSATAEELHKDSSLSATFLENGIDETENLTIANFTEISDRKSLLNVEKSSKSSPRVSKDFTTISPEVETKTPETLNISSTKCSSNTLNSFTSKPSDMSKFHSKRKESFKKIRDVFERQNVNESAVNNEAVYDQKLTRNSGKTLLATKPSQSKILPPHLENTVSPLEEKFSNARSGLYSAFSDNKTTFKAQPKPYKGSVRSTEMPKLPETKSVDYLEMDKEKKVLKLTAKPYGVNISNFSERKTWDKSKQLSEHEISAAELEILQEQNLSKDIETTSAMSSVRLKGMQDNTKGRTNSYRAHSSKPTTTSILSQASLPPERSRTYMPQPTVSHNTRLSKKDRVVSNIDSTEQGVFV